MIRMSLLAVLAASTLAGCGQGQLSFVAGYDGTAGGVSDAHVLAQLATTPASQQSTAARKIAVTRGFTLRLPGNEVATVQERHLAECAKLGCTVLETRLDRLSEGRISARASVRVAMSTNVSR
jgi:hypothetical protein